MTPEELDLVNDDLLNALQNKDWNTTYYPLIKKGINDGTLDLATLKQWINLAKKSTTGEYTSGKYPINPNRPSWMDMRLQTDMKIDADIVPDDLRAMFNYLNANFFNGSIPSNIPVTYKKLQGDQVGLTTIDLITENDDTGQSLKDNQGRPVYKTDSNGQPIYKPDSAYINIDDVYNPAGWDQPEYKDWIKRKLILILLHEMTHAYFDTHGRPGEGHHKNFQAKCSDIAQKIGLTLSDLLGDAQPDMDESRSNSRIKQLAGLSQQ